MFLGTVGYGAYFTPRFRGDLTIDFRSTPGPESAGHLHLRVQLRRHDRHWHGDRQGRVNNAVMLANLYWDLLPRGFFTPYIGAGIGFVYYDATRTYIDYRRRSRIQMAPRERQRSATRIRASSLAAALMAGATFAIDQHWLIDVNYRALYLGEVEVVTTVQRACRINSSRVTIGDTWEHQARIGLRYNIW